MTSTTSRFLSSARQPKVPNMDLSSEQLVGAGQDCNALTLLRSAIRP
jgi:hypothetical protein